LLILFVTTIFVRNIFGDKKIFRTSYDQDVADTLVTWSLKFPLTASFK